MKNLIYSIILIFILSISNFVAQTYTLNSSTNGTTVTTCSGTFVDQGGVSGTYSNNSDYTITFCSGSSQLIRIDFSVLNIESGWDFLEVFDGPSINSPSLDNITGNIGSYILQSTGPCMTFRFTSDITGKTAGWEGIISCAIPCSIPLAGGTITNQTNPVKVCLNETLEFSGASSTAGSGFSISNYAWDFDDGSTATGVVTSHSYSDPGRYIIQLEVTDNNGCSNNNLIDLVVDVGTIPNFNGTSLDQVTCENNSVCINGVVNATTWQDIPPTNVSEPSALPDGSGICYEVPLTFTEFIPGLTITSASEVQNIYANVVHSWAGDLTLNLICPNNQSVGLFNSDGTWNTTNISSENFGNPVATNYYGFDYTWTNTGTTMNSWGATSTATTIPAGTYGSEEPFSNLIGCPINGTWILEVCDLHSIDSGKVFSWGITFDPSVYAGLSSITPVYDSNCSDTYWAGLDQTSSSLITSTAANCDQICITPTSIGVFDYIYSVTDDFGCTYDTTISITSNACGCNVTALNSGSVCPGSSVNLTSSNVTGALSFNWSGPNNFSSNLQNPNNVLVSTTPGQYIYNVVVTTLDGSCTAQTTVIVNPPPTVNDPSDQVTCSNQSITAIAFTGNSTGVTYDWLNSDVSIGLGASGTGDIASFISTNLGSSPVVSTITVTPTLNGCIGTPQDFTITVNPIPTVNDPTDQALCANASTTAIDFSGSDAGTSYDWLNDNTSIGLSASGTGDIFSFTATNTGATAITSNVTVTPILNGCTGTPQDFTITVNPIPTVIDPTDQVLCINSSTTAIAFSGNAPGTTYNWLNSDATIGLGASGMGDIASFTSSNSGSTPITANVSVTPTLNGCIGVPQTFTITINPLPIISAGLDVTICNGQSTTLTASGGLTYVWSPSTGLNSTITESVLANPSATTTYDVIGTDLNGCSNTSTVTVTVSPNIPVDAGSDIFICPGESATLTAAPVGTFTTVSWNNGAQDGVPFNPSATTTYTVTGTSANGCVTTDDVLVSILTPPTVTATDQTICAGSTATLSGSGASTYIWSPDGQTTSSIAVSLTSTTTYTITGTDANGCSGTGQVTVTVVPVPNAVFSADVLMGQVVLNVNFTNSSTNATSYVWDFGNGSNQLTNNQNPVSTQYVNEGVYTVMLVASNGLCNDSETLVITAGPIPPLEVEVPNVFTPNTDGSNEGYFVWTKNAATIDAVIVNRWGNTMVVIDDLNYKWDGKTTGGAEASEGVYFLKYKVTGLDGTEVTGHTFFQLIR
jgi:gliding motility-associated-like protein